MNFLLYSIESTEASQTCSKDESNAVAVHVEVGNQTPQKVSYRLSAKLKEELLSRYEMDRYPSAVAIASIANDLQTTPKAVQKWFFQQRLKERKKLSSSVPSKCTCYLTS